MFIILLYHYYHRRGLYNGQREPHRHRHRHHYYMVLVLIEQKRRHLQAQWARAVPSEGRLESARPPKTLKGVPAPSPGFPLLWVVMWGGGGERGGHPAPPEPCPRGWQPLSLLLLLVSLQFWEKGMVLTNHSSQAWSWASEAGPASRRWGRGPRTRVTRCSVIWWVNT